MFPEVIPAKAGIQVFRGFLDPGFGRVEFERSAGVSEAKTDPLIREETDNV
jgi:hypothetical protein